MPQLCKLTAKKNAAGWSIHVWIASQRHPNGTRMPVCKPQSDPASAWRAMSTWLRTKQQRHKLPPVSPRSMALLAELVA